MGLTVKMIPKPATGLEGVRLVCGNSVPADSLNASERLNEIAEILAAGLMRLRARQSTVLSRDSGESSLDCAGHQSSHADRLTSDGGLD